MAAALPFHCVGSWVGRAGKALARTGALERDAFLIEATAATEVLQDMAGGSKALETFNQVMGRLVGMLEEEDTWPSVGTPGKRRRN